MMLGLENGEHSTLGGAVHCLFRQHGFLLMAGALLQTGGKVYNVRYAKNHLAQDQVLEHEKELEASGREAVVWVCMMSDMRFLDCLDISS